MSIVQNRTRDLYTTVWGTDTHEVHPSAYANATELINAWMARDQFVFLQPPAGSVNEFIGGMAKGLSPSVGSLIAGMVGSSAPAVTLSADNLVQLLDTADPTSGFKEEVRQSAEQVLIATGGWRRGKDKKGQPILVIDDTRPLSSTVAVAAEAWRQKIIDLEAQLIEAGKMRPDQVINTRALREYENEVRRQQRLQLEIPRRMREAEELMRRFGVPGGQPAQ